MEGKLSAVEITSASTATLIYTVPAVVRSADVHISILNPNTNADAVVKVAITTAASPEAADYIENGATIPMGGGVLERDETLAPGEKIYVYSSVAAVVVRVSGKEKP